MTSRRTCLALLALLLAAPLSARHKPVQAPKFDLKRPEIVAFVNDMVTREQLKKKQVLALLRKGEPQPKIIEAMTRPAEKVTPWWEYHDRFLTEERISEGAQFYAEHRESLERIASARGIPPEYLVAIMGVETKYGRVTGHYRVLDALMTLSFDYPPRSDYFRGELEQFLLLYSEEHIDPLKVTGSYAGAMGVPQFMPSSYRLFAVDGNADGKRDLWNDWDDILASIANYFVEHGWEAGGPVLAETKLEPEPKFQIDTRNLELNETVDSLNAQGVEILADQTGTTPVVLVSAEQQDGPAYRVGFKNFYVITRYNRSARYAMAVHDLAAAIIRRVNSGQTLEAARP
ncbi:MAG: Lytic murein transglycosylase [Gammaproteobacteria bacterium]|nr:Lytic murein transglycosylase [Gammaproteobacteria bacterium]